MDDSMTSALLAAMMRAAVPAGYVEDPVHDEVLNSVRKRSDGLMAAAKLQAYCEKHDKDSLPRVRFWVRAYEALGDCKTPEEADTLFAANLADYTRDYIDKRESRSVNAMRNLWYGSCAITRFTLATQTALTNKVAEVKAAAKATKEAAKASTPSSA